MKYAAAALSVATILSVAHAVIRDDDPAATIVDSAGHPLSDRSLRGGNPFEEDDNGMATYIVTFADDSGDRGNKAAALAKANGGSVGAVYKRVLNGAAMTLPKAAANGLKNNPQVASVDEDQLMYAAAQMPCYTWGQDRIDQCDSGASDDSTGNGRFERQDASNVKIYVLDTGIYAPHSDFTYANGDVLVDPGCSFSVTNGRDQSMADTNGHGTHVASTICGKKYGVVTCGAGMLCGVQVLSSSGSGSTSGIIAAIDDAVAHCNDVAIPAGAKGCVANMSLGGGGYTPLDNAVNAAVANGMTMVVAAGNDSGNACSYSPARAADAITVGATDSSDNLASFTNKGSCVDVFAPGVSTIAASAGTTDGTRTYSGTSMASPHVAALAAAEIQKDKADVVGALEAGVTMMHVDCTNPGTGIATNGNPVLDCSTTTNSCGPTGSPPTSSPPPPPPPPAPTCRGTGETCMKNNCQNWSGCAGQGSSCCCCGSMECGGSGRTGTCA